MNKKIVALLALVALAGFAAASALTVKQRQDTASLHAERYTIGEQFVIDTSSLYPVLATAPAAGTSGAAIEMTSAFPAARTALTRDHWMYGLVVKEAGLAAVGSGQFTVELQVDGVSVATVYVAQIVSDATAVEGVTVSFDLGTTINPSSLYYVLVKPLDLAGPTVSFKVESNPNDNLTWVGVGAPINGVVSPTLSFALGSTISLTARNSDDITHNIGFKSGAGVISPPGWSELIDTNGEEVTITWKPSSAGSYTYNCNLHSGMKGEITVTP